MYFLFSDIQFWKNRRSLEGLSVRSVFFNVFQSVIVLLYVLDNDTNFLVRVSVGIGLLIELWKIQKVLNIEISRNERMLFGLLPFKIKFSDKGSYVDSSTKQYDLVFSFINFHLLNFYFLFFKIFLVSIQVSFMGSVSIVTWLFSLFIDLQRA